MSALSFMDDIVYIVSDITAGAFLIVLTVTITVHSTKSSGLTHLFAGTVLILAGIFMRIFAGTLVSLPEGFTWKYEAFFLTAKSAPVIGAAAFALLSLGITESASQIIYNNEKSNSRKLKERYAATVIIIAAGTALYVYIGSNKMLTVSILIQYIYLLIHISRQCSRQTVVEYWHASVAAVITFALAFVFDPVRLTGLGLSVMMLIVSEQYHKHISIKLAENEAALAKSKVRTLTEQISPHYIYNSLQSISSLCEADPPKARAAINSFADYLRGNLESLTAEGLIPFTRELEHTRAYLALEEAAGNKSFRVEYQLETTDFMLPPLVLQPVVENAVKHGAVRGTEENGQAVTVIVISTRETADGIILRVTDRREGGKGYTSSAPYSAAAAADDASATSAADARVDNSLGTAKNSQKKKSIGLENVRTRLAILSGASLNIESTPDGTDVTILLRSPAE